MISSQDYLNRAKNWRQIFERCMRHASRTGAATTVNLDTDDCQQLLSLCERIIDIDETTALASPSQERR